MRYLLLIYSNESDDAKLTPEENAQLMADYGAFHQALEGAGKHIDGARLRPTDVATTVRVRNGDLAMTDGPFAETKEHLGGFYMIEAENLDEATQWASKIPTAHTGSIEVRPIWEDEDM